MTVKDDVGRASGVQSPSAGRLLLSFPWLVMAVLLAAMVLAGPDLASRQSAALIAVGVLLLIAAALAFTRGALLIVAAISGFLGSLGIAWSPILQWTAHPNLEEAVNYIIWASLVATVVALVVGIRYLLSRPTGLDGVLTAAVLIGVAVFAVVGGVGPPEPGPISFQSVDPGTSVVSAPTTELNTDEQIRAVAHLSRRSAGENLYFSECSGGFAYGFSLAYVACHTVGKWPIGHVTRGTDALTWTFPAADLAQDPGTRSCPDIPSGGDVFILVEDQGGNDLASAYVHLCAR